MFLRITVERSAWNRFFINVNFKIKKTFGPNLTSADDGPHPSYTEQLPDGLKERGVHATFFVTGEHAELHPDIIKRMQEEGYLIFPEFTV